MIKCQEKIEARVCGRKHHRLLHGSDATHASLNAARLQPRLAGQQRQTCLEDSQRAL